MVVAPYLLIAQITAGFTRFLQIIGYHHPVRNPVTVCVAQKHGANFIGTPSPIDTVVISHRLRNPCSKMQIVLVHLRKMGTCFSFHATFAAAQWSLIKARTQLVVECAPDPDVCLSYDLEPPDELRTTTRGYMISGTKSNWVLLAAVTSMFMN